MNARHSPTPAPGPDLLARYLNAYLQARQMSDVERPWGLGDDGLDGLWCRLTAALADDPLKLDRIVADELSDDERQRIVETLAPLIFALPLRSYPAELRAERIGARLVLSLRHLENGQAPHKPEIAHKSDPHEPSAPPNSSSKEKPAAKRKPRDKEKEIESVGHLPAALTAALDAYLRRVLRFGDEKSRRMATISSGGRRRRVRVTILARDRGVVVRFLERLHSPVDDGA